ncbi:unnamed protein product [Sphagnum tenellum]
MKMRDIMRIVENETVYYHGSNAHLPIGTVLRTSGEVAQQHFYHRERLLERLRPKDQLSRIGCIYLLDSPRRFEEALGYRPENVYRVRPGRIVQRSDVSWIEAMAPIEDLDDDERAWVGEYQQYDYLVKYAQNYWDGVRGEGPWEYRSDTATVLEML